jgi:molecular chaperone GrpE
VDTTGEKDQKDEKEPAVRVVDRRWWARGETPGAVEAAARKPTYIEDLEQRLADTTAQLQRVMTEHRRALEEFEQVKTRLRRDVGREVERGKRGLLGDLLEVLDNLDRALSATSGAGPSAAESTAGAARPAPQDELEQFVRGVRLVHEQFLGKLSALGVSRLAVIGQPFDAQRHEAVTTTAVMDAAQDGVVVAVLKEGYAIGDEILRPASVVVGRLAG